MWLEGKWSSIGPRTQSGINNTIFFRPQARPVRGRFLRGLGTGENSHAYEIGELGHFITGHFITGHFITDTLPRGHFTTWSLYHTDTLSRGHLRTRTFYHKDTWTQKRDILTQTSFHTIIFCFATVQSSWHRKKVIWHFTGASGVPGVPGIPHGTSETCCLPHCTQKAVRAAILKNVHFQIWYNFLNCMKMVTSAFYSF